MKSIIMCNICNIEFCTFEGLEAHCEEQHKALLDQFEELLKQEEYLHFQ